MANYWVLLNCFPLFLHSLTCLITLILWRKVFHRPKAGGGHGGQGPHSSAPLQNLPFREKACSEGCPLSGVWVFQASSLGEGNKGFLPFCPSLKTAWKSLRKPTVAGSSLAIQRLGLVAFTAVVWARSRVRKLRSCKLCGMTKKERKTNSGFVDQGSEVDSSPHLAYQSLRYHWSGVAVASLLCLVW